MPYITDRDLGDESDRLGDLNVAQWRFERLLEAGYPSDVADMLAYRQDVDLHLAVSLLTRGATIHEALRILT